MRIFTVAMSCAFLLSCGTARSFITATKNDAPCSEGSSCLCGQVLSSKAALLEGARVVVYSEAHWVAERGKPLPQSVGSLSDDDIRPGDMGGTRATTDRMGRFCVSLHPDDRYLVVVLRHRMRPAAAIFPAGSNYAVALLVEGPEFRWGL